MAIARDLLPTWLGIPADPWPPDHHALLGLPADVDDPAVIERHVLERMELLRQHQLMHPDEATEGMNLLARAMIALTAPPKLEPIAEPAVLIDVPVPAPVERQFIEAPLPVSLPLPPDVASDVYPIEPEPADELPMALPRDVRPRPVRGGRRQLYADIVRVRRAMKTWGRLVEFFEVPERTFTRRTDIVALMNTLSDLLPVLPTTIEFVGGPGQPGHVIAGLARQQPVVEMFRSLLPGQCEALARDCRLAHLTLRNRYGELRDALRQQTERNFSRKYVYPLGRELLARPEWVLLAMGVLSLGIALVRSLPH